MAHHESRHSRTHPRWNTSCPTSHPVHPDPDRSVGLAAVQHHLYDAQGERGLKGLGTITEFYVNGETKGYGASLGNYVRYVSGYFVVDGHGRVSKHYYAGAERVVSRLAGEVAGYLESEDLEGEQLSTLRSRQQRDVQAAIKTWDLQIFPFLNYPKPTDNCSLYPSGSEDHKQCICDQQNTCTEVLYWYHPDHLGSSTFLSDAAGEPYQFVLYLPFGETFAEQRAAEWSTPYLFNAKELDTETGLYYYGARYYDPRVSMWWGVDPMAGKYPNEGPYLYTSNNPIRYIDPTGMEKEDWYLPTGGTELVFDKSVTSQKSIDNSSVLISGTYIGSSAYRVKEDGNTVSYNSDGTKSSAIGLPEVLVVGHGGSNIKGYVSSSSDALSGLGVGLIEQGGSMRITNGAYNGNSVSFRYYESGWKGGSRAKISTYQLGTTGRLVSRVGTAGTLAIGAYDIGINAYHEGGFGTYTQQATGRFTGSLLGATAGAKAGAAVGAWFYGWGAIPGGIIGGIIGGYGGSKAGEGTVKQIQKAP
jgi:RHS repeat-associated protein